MEDEEEEEEKTRTHTYTTMRITYTLGRRRNLYHDLYLYLYSAMLGNQWLKDGDDDDDEE